jgi:MFS family permease
MLGDGLAILAVPLLVLQLTSNPAVAVLAALPGSAGYLAAGAVAGVVADRVSPWILLIWTDGGLAVIFVTMFAKPDPVWLLLLLALAAGLVTVFADTARDIAVRDVFSGPRLIAANSWLESLNQAGQILGPAGAGLLAAAGVLRVSLLLDAVTFAVSLGTLLAVRGAWPAAHSGGGPAVGRRELTARGELTAGIRYLVSTPLLRALLGFVAVLNLCLGADKLVVFLARVALRLPPEQTGLVLTAGGVGGLLGAVSAGLLSRRVGPVPLMLGCSLLSGAALVMLAVATGWPLVLAGNALYTWAIIAASVVLRALRQSLVPRALLGRVTASWRLVSQAVTLAGALLAGILAALAGGDPRPVLLGAGLLTIGTVVTAWLTGLRRAQWPARAG